MKLISDIFFRFAYSFCRYGWITACTLLSPIFYGLGVKESLIFLIPLQIIFAVDAAISTRAVRLAAGPAKWSLLLISIFASCIVLFVNQDFLFSSTNNFIEFMISAIVMGYCALRINICEGIGRSSGISCPISKIRLIFLCIGALSSSVIVLYYPSKVLVISCVYFIIANTLHGDFLATNIRNFYLNPQYRSDLMLFGIHLIILIFGFRWDILNSEINDNLLRLIDLSERLLLFFAIVTTNLQAVFHARKRVIGGVSSLIFSGTLLFSLIAAFLLNYLLLFAILLMTLRLNFRLISYNRTFLFKHHQKRYLVLLLLLPLLGLTKLLHLNPELHLLASGLMIFLFIAFLPNDSAPEFPNNENKPTNQIRRI